MTGRGCVLLLGIFLAIVAPAAPVEVVAQLTSADEGKYSAFGSSVSLSDNRLVVGALGEGTDVGAAYIFLNNASGWSQETKLFSDDTTDAVQFGYAVAISADTAMVSAPLEENGGAVFVFSRAGGQWVQQQKIIPSELGGVVGSCFGCSIALSGNMALIGAPEKIVDSNMQQGAVYIFMFDGTQWVQTQELMASDGASGDMFGTVALHGNTALIGASGTSVGRKVAVGSVYVFSLADNVWAQQQEFHASDGQSDDYFGASVALSNNVAAVGSALHKVGANAAQGQAYIFSPNNGLWTQQQTLRALDGAAQDQFGTSIALTEDTVVVSAIGKKTGSGKLQGAVYTFTSAGSQRTQFQEINGSDPNGGSYFGSALAIQGSTALVGAAGANSASNVSQGAAYVFDHVGDRISHNGFETFSN